MLFNSYEFIFVFLPITFFIYFYLNKKKLIVASKSFLVCCSLFFYSWWNLTYLPIIIASMVINYIIGRNLSNSFNFANKKFSRKSILIIGILFNICLLGYFKYADFFIENFNIVFGVNVNSLDLLLPLAISFFTFQQVAYLVDCFRQETEEYSFLNYALFVTFFPQLIAGPIVHHKEMMPQFARIKNKFQNYNNIARGLFIFSIGLFKKVVIADTFAIWATNGFDLAENLNLFEAWATSLSYTFQLYFDFSGYTDMAIGLALIFNIKLPINFNSPYKSTNIQDFWRRWHITLSRFLRDYLYIPLGGNKKGSLRTYCNLMATFVLGGFWHGAGWTFVFWGFLHGIALIFQRLWSKLGFKLWTWFAWLITFNFLNITWIFFRAKEWDDAIKVLSSMFSFENIVLPRLLNEKLAFLSKFQIEFGGIANNINGNILTPIYLIAALFVIVVFKNSIYKLYKFEANYNSLLFTSFTLFISILHLTKVTDFLYFNF